MTAALDPQPLVAFDVAPDGGAQPLAGTLPLGHEPETGRAFRWLHFDATDPALEAWCDQNLPDRPGTELQRTGTRPRCDWVGDGLILNLRGVNLNPGAEVGDMISLRLWVTERLVVSARLKKIFAVDELRQRMEKGHGPATTSRWLVEVIVGLTDRIDTVCTNLETQTDALEDTIIEEEMFDAADGIAPLRRAVIQLRRYIGPQREALSRLTRFADERDMPDDSGALSELANRTTRLVEELDALSARLTALQDHVANHNAERMARHGNILSIVAAIFLPLSFLTGLFGINVGGMPGLNSPIAFAVVAGGSIVIAVALLAFFRWRHWF